MTRAEKQFYQGFGAMAYGIQFEAGSIHLAVEYVYPDSPAAKAGLKRGDFIAKINGVALNESNWVDYLIDTFIYEVPVGTVCNLEVQEFNWTTFALTAPRQVTMTAASYCENPVLYYDVFTFKSTQDENKQVNIAYMVYNAFEAAYDDEIKKAFDLFAQASTENQKPIDYLILDLRYNGGGSVSSCCYLSSLIAGNKALKGGNPQVFMYQRFNDERMAEQGRDRNDYTTYKADLFDKSAASAYNFPFKEVYVIGTFDTASSSEMLISALRGIDMKVTLVGQTTNGKNVGMEVFNTQSSGSPIDGNHYIFAPITFQSYNCKGESNYDNGFTPDIHCKKSDWDGMPPVDWGTFTVEVKGDRPGETQAILADFFSVALNDLLTKEFSAQSSVKRLAMPSEGSMPKVATRLASPAKKMDIFRQNAWVLAEEE
jgi:C-terminal processing protease CtpA/Prc